MREENSHLKNISPFLNSFSCNTQELSVQQYILEKKMSCSLDSFTVTPYTETANASEDVSRDARRILFKEEGNILPIDQSLSPPSPFFLEMLLPTPLNFFLRAFLAMFR